MSISPSSPTNIRLPPPASPQTAFTCVTITPLPPTLPQPTPTSCSHYPKLNPSPLDGSAVPVWGGDQLWDHPLSTSRNDQAGNHIGTVLISMCTFDRYISTVLISMWTCYRHISLIEGLWGFRCETYTKRGGYFLSLPERKQKCLHVLRDLLKRKR